MSIDNPFLSINQKLDLIDQKLNHLVKSSKHVKTAEKKEFLSSPQAADYLCITLTTLNKYASEGKIPYHKPSGYKFRLFKLSELKEWVEKGRKGTIQEVFNSPKNYSIQQPTRKKIGDKIQESHEYMIYRKITKGLSQPQLWPYKNIPERF
jgi:excisionase family DNA binding protein